MTDKVARLHAQVVSGASGSTGLAQSGIPMGQVLGAVPVATVAAVPMQMPMAPVPMQMAPMPMQIGRSAKIDFREPRVDLDLAPVQITGDCCSPSGARELRYTHPSRPPDTLDSHLPFAPPSGAIRAGNW